MREQAMNSATLVEKRSKDKAFGKLINNAQNEAKRFKRGG
jgi:ribosome biogenesis GTPase